MCVAHCPVAASTLNFRGPKLTGPAYERFRLLGFGDETSLEYCSNCKCCDLSCPSGVPVATFNMLARAAYCRQHPPPLRDWLLAHFGTVASLAAYIPAFALNLGKNNPISRLGMRGMGIDSRAPFPDFAPLSQRRALKKHKQPPAGEKTIALFPGCFISNFEPQVALDSIALFRKAGYTVVIPENFVCCGLPLIANGYADDALDNARANSLELAQWAQQNIPVIAACPSCALMLQREYRELFPREQGLGRYAATVMDACEFVSALMDKGELSLEQCKPPVDRLAYHAPCHLRAQGIGRTGMEMLRRIPGLAVEDMDSGCCGISGSYGFKRNKYDIAMRVGAPLFDALRNSKANLAVSECGTCRVQMRHGSSLPAEHPLSFLLRTINKA